ncbi:hypothetical protein EMIHUDRAFT_58282, partial [Emiliania huxleyi CCMP1516]|uniref:PWI domain-containing protein n=2 Tax=Emiliania huxleyi TaxID=2903 RepID=A0A0D3IE09_EMIH1
FRGVSADQDGRFGDKMKKMIKSTKFPAHFETKVDMKKVNLDVMLPWITEQVSEYLGFEDEVVIGYVESQLRETDVDPKKMQLSLTGFLEANTPPFMRDLWALLVSAQENEHGIPTKVKEDASASSPAAAREERDGRERSGRRRSRSRERDRR